MNGAHATGWVVVALLAFTANSLDAEDLPTGIRVADQQIVLDANSPARSIDLANLGTVSTKSRWPLTDEERAMVPDDGTRDSSKWKMKNK